MVSLVIISIFFPLLDNIGHAIIGRLFLFGAGVTHGLQAMGDSYIRGDRDAVYIIGWF